MARPKTTLVINESLIRECVHFEGNIKPGLALGEDTLARASGTVGLVGGGGVGAGAGVGGGGGGARGAGGFGRGSNQQSAADRQAATREQQLLVPLHEVTSLMFSFKNIGQISNLVGVDRITKLCLDNNRIQRIENIGHLKQLKWLDLSFNQITVIEGLDALAELENLSLHNNEIATVEGMDKLTKLACLALGKNKIEALDSTATYLHRFRQLRMVSLSGNPVESHVLYRSRMLAYVRNLKYLDNRMVLASEVAKARDESKEQMMPIDEADLREDEAAAAKKTAEEDGKHYDTINCPNEGIFFQEIYSLEPEGTRSIVALLEVDALRDRVKELVDKFREDFTQVCKEMADKMKDLRKRRDQNERDFDSTLGVAKAECDAACRELIKQYERALKRVVPYALRAKPDQDTPDQTDQLAELRQRLDELKANLMEHEADQLDAYEKVLKHFEDVLHAHRQQAQEVLSNHFEELRSQEKTFQMELKRRLDLWSDEKMRQAQDVEGGYATAAPEHAAAKDKHLLQMLENKDEYGKVLSEWSDMHIKRLDEKEEFHKKREEELAKSQHQQNMRHEQERSRARVREIHAYVERTEARISRWEGMLDAL